MSDHLDLDSVTNLKHRAILKALLETDLNQSEIARRLSVNKVMVHTVAYRYLSKEYLEQRQQRLQLLELHRAWVPADESCATESATEDCSSDDEVTVLALPTDAAASSSSIQALPEPTSELSNVSSDQATRARDLLSRTHQKIYDFLAQNFDPNEGQPSISLLAQMLKNHGLGTHSNSYLVAARHAWLKDCLSTRSATTATLAPTPTPVSTPRPPTIRIKPHQTAQASDPLIHLSAEYGGFKISWECSAQERTDSITLVLTTLKSLAGGTSHD